MRVYLRTCVVGAVLALCAAPVAAQVPLEASLSFVSDPGDYIGAGQTRSFTLDTAAITSRTGSNGGYFNLTMFPFDGGFWYVDLAAPAGSQLTTGAYEGAVRWPFMGPGQPGVSITGDGRGCNTATGRFDVLDVAFGPNGYIERFHARFEQHCEGLVAALRGEVLVVNPPPPPALDIQLSFNPNGRVDRLTGKVTMSGQIQCTVPTSAGINLALSQRLTRFSLASGSASTSLPCSPTARSWTLEVTPVGDVPFGNGFAQLDVSVSGYDSYYGNFVNRTAGGAIKLGQR